MSAEMPALTVDKMHKSFGQLEVLRGVSLTANDGDVICISNFETALLDLPIKSPKDDAERFFVANTEQIPPLETKVVVILEPVVEAKKDKK